MLGGIDNSLFLQGLSGFFAMGIFILILKWVSPTKKDPVDVKRRKSVEESPHELPHK